MVGRFTPKAGNDTGVVKWVMVHRCVMAHMCERQRQTREEMRQRQTREEMNRAAHLCVLRHLRLFASHVLFLEHAAKSLDAHW
jgi:hypothetical protein